MTKNREQELQQAALELQIMEQQIRQFEEQFNQIETKRFEIEKLETSLGDFKKSKNREVFADVGLGIYAKTKLVSETDLLVNVGAGVYTLKKVDEVRRILKKQSKELEQIAKEIVQHIQTLSMQAQGTQEKLEKLS